MKIIFVEIITFKTTNSLVLLCYYRCVKTLLIKSLIAISISLLYDSILKSAGILIRNKNYQKFQSGNFLCSVNNING